MYSKLIAYTKLSIEQIAWTHEYHVNESDAWSIRIFFESCRLKKIIKPDQLGLVSCKGHIILENA